MVAWRPCAAIVTRGGAAAFGFTAYGVNFLTIVYLPMEAAMLSSARPRRRTSMPRRLIF
jgi:hypothetical protein